MYDDDVQAPLSLGASDRYYKVAKFPTRNIRTPIVLVYGGSDSLVDIKVMLKELPRHTVAIEVPHFEHLDFLWGQEVETLVFPHVLQALKSYAGRDHMQLGELTYGKVRNGRLAIKGASEFSEDDLSSPMSDTSPETNKETANSVVSTSKASSLRYSPSTPRNRKHTSPPSSSGTELTSASMDGAGDTKVTTRPKQSISLLNSSLKHSRKKSGSTSSLKSFDSGSRRIGDVGISIGAGKATTGMSSPGPALKNLQKVSSSGT